MLPRIREKQRPHFGSALLTEAAATASALDDIPKFRVISTQQLPFAEKYWLPQESPPLNQRVSGQTRFCNRAGRVSGRKPS